MGKESSQNEEPLVVSGHFNYSRREPKDRFWAYAYAACLAFTVIGGIVTVKHRSESRAERPYVPVTISPSPLPIPAAVSVASGGHVLTGPLRRAQEPSVQEGHCGLPEGPAPLPVRCCRPEYAPRSGRGPSGSLVLTCRIACIAPQTSTHTQPSELSYRALHER